MKVLMLAGFLGLATPALGGVCEWDCNKCEAQKVEIMLSVDESSSISLDTEWPQQVAFAEEFIRLARAEFDEPRMGLNIWANKIFSSIGKELLPMEELQDVFWFNLTSEDITPSISSYVHNMLGGTPTGWGFQMSADEFARNGQDDLTKICLTITDGEPTTGGPSNESPLDWANLKANDLKDEGILSLTLGVGNQVSRVNLEEWASVPKDIFAIKADSFASLNETLPVIIDLLCVYIDSMVVAEDCSQVEVRGHNLYDMGAVRCRFVDRDTQATTLYSDGVVNVATDDNDPNTNEQADGNTITCPFPEGITEGRWILEIARYADAFTVNRRLVTYAPGACSDKEPTTTTTSAAPADTTTAAPMATTAAPTTDGGSTDGSSDGGSVDGTATPGATTASPSGGDGGEEISCSAALAPSAVAVVALLALQW